MATVGASLRTRPSAVLAWIATAGTLALLLGQKAVRPHRAALRRLADIPLTLAGIGAADWAAFGLPGRWGWLVTGASLIVLEHLIADSDDLGGPA